MDLLKLKPEAKKEILGKIVKELDHLDEEQLDEICGVLFKKLDELDGDDFFGTEGWKHYFGVED